MKTKNLFYLLLALPLILSSCNKTNDEESTTNTENYDVCLEAKYLVTEYWGSEYTPGADNFSVIIAENEFMMDIGGASLSEGSYYCLDIYTPITANGKLPAGTYTLDMTESYAAGTIDGTISSLIKVDANGNFITDDEGTPFSEATLVITENHVELTAVIDNETHYVTFSGEFEYIDSAIGGGDILRTTTLTNDVEVEGEAALFVAEYDEYDYDSAYIMVMENYGEYGAGDGALFMLEVALAEGSTNISGTYSVEDGTLNIGTLDAYGMWGSWYFDTIDGELGSKYAALQGGSVTFNHDGDSCAMTLDCSDIEGHTIKATLSGAFISDSPAPESLSNIFNR